MIQKIIERWSKIGLFRDLSEEFIEGTAYMLENQRLFNEGLAVPAIFRRISIALARRVFSQLDHSIIPLSSSSYDSGKANVRALGVLFDPPDGLYAEFEWLATCAEQIVEEINNWLKTLDAKEVMLFQFGITPATSDWSAYKFLLYYQLFT